MHPNPFALLGLSPTFSLDARTLEKAYFDAQRKSHPDQFSRATPEAKADAARLSTAINQAYLCLKDPLQRAAVLLAQAGVEPLASDPSFLMQVMEWREAQSAGEDVTAELAAQETLFLQQLGEGFDVQDFERVRHLLYRLTYLRSL